MTTRSEKSQFIESIVSSDLLDNAIEWIQNNMEPYEIFTDEQLGNWAEGHDFVRKDEE